MSEVNESPNWQELCACSASLFMRKDEVDFAIFAAIAAAWRADHKHEMQPPEDEPKRIGFVLPAAVGSGEPVNEEDFDGMWA